MDFKVYADNIDEMRQETFYLLCYKCNKHVYASHALDTGLYVKCYTCHSIK